MSTPEQVREKLLNGTENIADLNPTYEGAIGRGRLNAARALMSLKSVTPFEANISDRINLKLSGVGFVQNMSIFLRKENLPLIKGLDFFYEDPNLISSDFDFAGATAGTYDVVVRIGQTEVTLVDGFRVLGKPIVGNEATPPVANVSPNPFRPDRGDTHMTFARLALGSQLRIYDRHGNLIGDLRDDNNDGQIDWSVTDPSGDRVVSGVYPYVATDESGNTKKGLVSIIR
jgi:hypothetical protein